MEISTKMGDYHPRVARQTIARIDLKGEQVTCGRLETLQHFALSYLTMCCSNPKLIINFGRSFCVTLNRIKETILEERVKLGVVIIWSQKLIGK